jgi:formate C-acetyltransferase
MLANVALPIRPEDLIVGSPAGAWATALPAGVDEDALAQYATLDRAVGQRSFITNLDHMAVDYAGLLRVGLPGLCHQALQSRDVQHDADRRLFLDSMVIALQAAIAYCRRWRDACLQAANMATSDRREELRRMAADLEAIAAGPPETFAQAVQLVWLVHVIFCLEGRGSMAFGRMDQYLYPYYRHSIEQGEDPAALRAVLACLWAKMEEPLIENPVQNIAIGGQDTDGRDATNELSYLMLEVTCAVRTPNSNLSARFHRGTPDTFYQACSQAIKTGVGFPAVFNDEVLVPAVVSLGIPLHEARDYAFVGCIETFLPGRMPPWSDSRVNLLAALEQVLERHAGDMPATFEALWQSYEDEVASMVAAHCDEISARKRALPAHEYTSPFLSAFVQDCIARGLDVNMGGTRYPDMHGPCGMGLGSTADALAAVKWFVYDRRELEWAELRAALAADYAGHEALRLRLLNGAPKYGNDDPYVDDIAARIVTCFTREVLRHRTPSGGRHVPLMAANTANIAAGREVGATPDGRHALSPVSDAASPTFGRDRRGPTAVIASLSRVDYVPVVGGTVVNMKFAPGTLAGDAGTAALTGLIRSYFDRGGMQLQFNVTGREVLEAARRDPEAYRDLVVRVSGFSALYVTLDDAVQRDILARTEH